MEKANREDKSDILADWSIWIADGENGGHNRHSMVMRGIDGKCVKKLSILRIDNGT